HRGQGLAKMLMKATLEKLASYLALKLDATPAGFPVYAALGFVPEYSIYRLVRLSREISTKHPDQPSLLEETSLQGIIDVDQKTRRIKRERSLPHLLQQSPDIVRGTGGENSIKGDIMGRLGTKYYQLGPLLAESMDTAIRLIASALADL